MSDARVTLVDNAARVEISGSDLVAPLVTAAVTEALSDLDTTVEEAVTDAVAGIAPLLPTEPIGGDLADGGNWLDFLPPAPEVVTLADPVFGPRGLTKFAKLEPGETCYFEVVPESTLPGDYAGATLSIVTSVAGAFPTGPGTFRFGLIPSSGAQDQASFVDDGSFTALDTTHREYQVVKQMTTLGADAILGFIQVTNNHGSAVMHVSGFGYKSSSRVFAGVDARNPDPFGKAQTAALAEAVGFAGAQPHPDLLVPTSYFLKADAPTPVFVAGLTPFREATVYDFAAAGPLATTKGFSFATRRALTLEAEKLAGAGGIYALPRGDETTVYQRPTTFLTAPATGTGSPKILVIGDSLAWRGWVDDMFAELAADGLTPAAIGTYQTIGGTLAEARPSWATLTNTYASTEVNADGTGDILPVTSDAAYLALSPSGATGYGPRWEFNPFLRPATGGDPAGIVNNGYVFDMASYLSRFSLASPDVVIIALGVNDVLREFATADTKKAFGVMYSQTRAALPTAKVAFTLYGLSSLAAWNDCVTLIKSMLVTYAGREGEGIYILPFWQLADMKLGYDDFTAPSATNTYGVKTAAVGDGIHPVDQGVTHALWGRAAANFVRCVV